LKNKLKPGDFMHLIYQVVFALLLVFGSSFADETPSPTKKPLEAPQFTTLVMLIKAAGLQDVFVGTGPFTIFAPSNTAFDNLGKEKLNELLKVENKDQLTDILTYHVIPGKYLSSHLKSMETKTVNGKNIKIKVENGQVKVNNAIVTKKDMIGPNGVIYEIDTVLIPAK
jgi:uncharacterized surface protein with fasciclin (FAS1) repeats